MSALLLNFFTIFFTFIDIFIYYRLLNNKLTYRFSRRTLIPAYSTCYIFLLLCTGASEWFPNVPIKILFMLSFFIILFAIYNDVFYKRILWIIVTFFSTTVCELIILPFVLLCTNTSFTSFSDNLRLQIVGTIFSRLLLLIIVEFLVRTKKKLFDGFMKNFLLIILVDVTYAFIICNLFYINNIYLTTDMAIALSLFVMFVISILALYLLRKITKKSDEIMTTNLKLQQIEMEHKQNQDMAIVVEDLRALRHDMNNHMSILQGLLTMEEYDDAKAYLSTITEELTVANSFVFTDNKVLSVLLNNKISKASQLGITFEPELLTSSTPLSDSDLCAVIGNILENAIEASAQHENPYIYFSMKKANHQLLIQCDNTFTIPPVFEKGNLITTKSNKTYHGIGTKTIRSVVEVYHGTTEFTVDELFHVTILIPL